LRSWKKSPSPLFNRIIRKIILKHAPVFLDQKWEVVIPIPQQQNRMVELRGGSSYLLAQMISEILNIPLTTSLSIATKETAQAKKNQTNRLIDAPQFELANKNAMPKKILLVDDFSTTGSTLDAATSVFKSQLFYPTPDVDSIVLCHQKHLQHLKIMKNN
jgi:predicted amidophosphoribosyltransferase